MRKQHFLMISGIIFLVLEAILYVIILVQTFTNQVAPEFRYFVVVLAALFSLLLSVCIRKKKNLFLLLAFLFTCGADYFLVLADAYYEVAVLLFGVAQIFHCLRIFAQDARDWKSSLFLRLGLLALVTIGLILLKMASLLYLAGSFYIIQLVINAVDALRRVKQDKTYILLFLGLILFIFCDITVGLYGIYPTLGIPQKTAYLISDFTYLFYVPSQALIAYTGRNI